MELNAGEQRAGRLHPGATPSGCRVRAFVKLLDALHTHTPLSSSHGTETEVLEKGCVYPEYPECIEAAVLKKGFENAERIINLKRDA